MMKRQMEKIDIPPIPDSSSSSGTRAHASMPARRPVDMFGLTMDDFVPQVDEIIDVGEFYEKAAGGQIIFT